jgi:ornithine carbamoyltransferase
MTAATITHTPTDFLSVADLTADQFEYLLDLATEMKAKPDGWRDALATRTVACFFEKPSTRTRVSFAAAAYRLGAQALFLRPDELQLGRGEPIADTARVLASYAAAIVLRTFSQEEIEEVARWADVPVVNALSNTHHPCQVLADLLTVRERFGGLAGRTLAFVGDGSDNVGHSLMEAGALTGMRIVICSPADYMPAEEVVEAARGLSRRGGEIELNEDPLSGAADADAIYTDVWVSMGEEQEQQRRRSDLSGYQVNAELMRRAKQDAIFLHCLPAHRGEEVTADVIDGPASAVWQQAGNRLPTEQAVLYALTSGDWTSDDK